MHCRDSEQSKHFAVLYKIDAPEMAKSFLSSVSFAADSLGIRVTLIDAGQANAPAHFDTPASRLDAIAAPTIITNFRLAEIIKKKSRKLPVVRFDAQSDAGDNYYLAGYKAGRYVVNIFGSTGRFGILTSSLDDANANESIRGFREELLTVKNRWRQVNIITYAEDPDKAAYQFKNMNRFGARTIRLLADGNCEFLATLKSYKKNSYFIAADLHANKNSIKLVKEGVIDAMATIDFNNLGERLVFELATKARKKNTPDVLPFKCSILTGRNAGIHFE